jgi:hypothetical protein
MGVSMKTFRNIRYEYITVIPVIIIGWLFIGCEHTTCNVDRKTPTGIRDEEAIVMLLNSE